MSENVRKGRRLIPTWIVSSFKVAIRAQEVYIPDARLNAVIRGSLRKPVRLRTERDMLSI